MEDRSEYFIWGYDDHPRREHMEADLWHWNFTPVLQGASYLVVPPDLEFPDLPDEVLGRHPYAVLISWEALSRELQRFYRQHPRDLRASEWDGHYRPGHPPLGPNISV